MSNRNNETDYSNLTDVLSFAMEQFLKLRLHTMVPGIVQSYNQQTKRAVVRPALRRVRTDGGTFDLPAIVNVPIVFPSGGGFTLVFPLQNGDALPLVFSQRGLSRFKDVYEVTDPDTALFDLKDAVGLAGFGALTISPATTNGTSLQSEDGSNHIFVENGKIQVTSTASVIVNCQNATVNATNGTDHNGDLRVDGTITATEDIIADRDIGFTRYIVDDGDVGGAININQNMVLNNANTFNHGTVPIDNRHTHPIDVDAVPFEGNTGTPE